MKTYIVIEFSNETVDYPKDLPLPNTGDLIRINNNFGEVIKVSYIIQDTFREIRLIVK